MVAPMTRRIAIVLLLAATCLWMASCALPWTKKVPRATPIRFPKGNTPRGTRRNPLPVGKILMVNTEGSFVLIDCGGWSLPEAGSALKSFRNEAETGVIMVGSERKGTHVIADIVTGSPQKGDEVFQ